jgi:hypothetical protein
LPTHHAVKVGWHKYGYNKTIGHTLDGKKKRFWLGHDRAEAQRKAAHKRLKKQLVKTGACAKKPRVRLCLAMGKMAMGTNQEGLKKLFRAKGWRLFDDNWICDQLMTASKKGYENDVAFIVSKLLLRRKAKLETTSASA